ncbi:hypothetical protein Tco_0886364 [Tanacetum coccineum]
MNMSPSQVSPPRTSGSNEYAPLAGVPSKNTQAFTCSYQFNPLKLIQWVAAGCDDNDDEWLRGGDVTWHGEDSVVWLW